MLSPRDLLFLAAAAATLTAAPAVAAKHAGAGFGAAQARPVSAHASLGAGAGDVAAYTGSAETTGLLPGGHAGAGSSNVGLSTSKGASPTSDGLPTTGKRGGGGGHHAAAGGRARHGHGHG